MLKSIFVILALFFLMNMEIAAQSRDKDDKGGLGLGVQLGYQKAGDADEGRLFFGALLRAKFSEALGIEGAIGYRKQNYHNGYVSAISWPVTVSALIYPIPVAYLVGGVGWYHTTFDFTPNRTTTAELANQTKNPFGWHIGAGAELPLGESIKLFGDIRYVFLKYGLNDIENVPLKDLNSDFYTINVGLIFGLR